MKIEIKNVKYAAFASQETHCFEATVYVDGKRAFGVSNEGHGGCDNYYPLNDKMTSAEVWDWVKAINKELAKVKHTCNFDDPETGRPCVMSGSLEITVGDLMNEWLLLREVKKDMKKQVTYYDASTNSIRMLPSQHKPTPEIYDALRKVSWWKDGNIILNELPITRAAEYYERAGA